jgi:superfamily II DNA helicase RecQ
MKTLNNIPLWILLVGLMAPIALPAEDHDHEEHQDEEELEEREAAVMEYLEEIDPRSVELMEHFGNEEEDEYWEYVEEIAEALEEIEDLKEEAPEFAELYERILRSEVRMETLGSLIQHTDRDSEREDLKKELKELLPAAFADRMKEAEMEIQFLEQEVEEIRADLERRRTHQDRIIERRYQELTGADDGLEW